MNVFRITNDGIHKPEEKNLNDLYLRESFCLSNFKIALYSNDPPGTRVNIKTVLKYELPCPFNKYLYNNFVYLHFDGGNVKTTNQVFTILNILHKLFKLSDTDEKAISYSVMETTEDDEDLDEEDEEEYFDHNYDSNEDDEEVEEELTDDDYEDDSSKLDNDSSIIDDNSSLK